MLTPLNNQPYQFLLQNTQESLKFLLDNDDEIPIEQEDSFTQQLRQAIASTQRYTDAMIASLRFSTSNWQWVSYPTNNNPLANPSTFSSSNEKNCEEPECTQSCTRTPNKFSPSEKKRPRFQKKSNPQAILLFSPFNKMNSTPLKDNRIRNSLITHTFHPPPPP